jgi:osmotically-inducible protein OsmY
MLNPKTDLEEKVRGALEEDRRTADLTVEVTNNNTVITLEGRATSDEARRAAGEIAERVPGVTTVINDLKLEDEDEVETGLPAMMAVDEEETGVNSSLP